MTDPRPTTSIYDLLRAADEKLATLESENKELKASNEMAAEHMARGREHAARLETELDSLKTFSEMRIEYLEKLLRRIVEAPSALPTDFAIAAARKFLNCP